jgi:hypothetical protein
MRPGKGYYTEIEAAQQLGLSLEELRTLVRRHILPNSEEDVNKLQMTSFQPSDLLLLKLLSRGEVRTEVATA